jgi:hypothetical protein
MKNQKPDTKTPPPVAALERPQSLKKWASGLASIVERNSAEIFQDFEYRENNLTHADLLRTLSKIRNCASTIELRSKIDRSTGEIEAPCIHAANYCGQTNLCPQCASRVSDRRRARFRAPIIAATTAYKYAYMVTATIEATATWRDSIRNLMAGWRGFRLRGQKRKNRKLARDPGEFGKVLAGVSKIEIKRGKNSGMPHCHIHALFFTNEPLDFRVWSEAEKQKPREDRVSLRPGRLSKITEEWQCAVGGNGTGIDIQPLSWRAPKRKDLETKESYSDRCNNWSLSDSIFEQSREVLKYATKFETAPQAQEEKIFARDLIGIKSATYGRRCFQTFGAFRGISGSDFVGDENPRTENPLLYASRWDSDRYSPLREIKSPLFPEMEPGPYRSANLQTLNRIQGATRRMRTAIANAKADFLRCGFLSPAIFGVRSYIDGGGYTEKIAPLEPPMALVNDPHNLTAWEDWTDALTQDGRARYSEMRDYLRGESHVRLTGAPEELVAQAAFERSVYLRSAQYELDVIAGFLEILAPSPDIP